MSQKDDIRKHLSDGYSITPIEALNKYKIFRLAAIIFDLKEEGMLIETEIDKGKGNKFAKYSLTGYTIPVDNSSNYTIPSQPTTLTF